MLESVQPYYLPMNLSSARQQVDILRDYLEKHDSANLDFLILHAEVLLQCLRSTRAVEQCTQAVRPIMSSPPASFREHFS
jgi:hypothetical protein